MARLTSAQRGRMPSKDFAKSRSSDRTPVGFGSLKHRNKPINAPSSLSGRRAAAHAKAYRD